MALFQPDVNEETMKALEQKFVAEDFQRHEAIVGADGVGVL